MLRYITGAFVFTENTRRESNPRDRLTKTGGYRYNTGAIHIQSAQWESNPHFRLGKAAGSRYIMGAEVVSRGGRIRTHAGSFGNSRATVTPHP